MDHKNEFLLPRLCGEFNPNGEAALIEKLKPFAGNLLFKGLQAIKCQLLVFTCLKIWHCFLIALPSLLEINT